MIALDTNVAVRLIVRDDPKQLQAAKMLLKEECFIGWTVLLELGWVLDAIYGLNRDEIVAGIAGLLDMETVTVPNELAVRWALERFAEGADYADMIHLAACDRSTEFFATFEKKLARKAGPDSPASVRTLRA